MSVDHFGPGRSELRLVGYDKETEELLEEHVISADWFSEVVKIAQVPTYDPNVAYCYPLTLSQAGAIGSFLSPLIILHSTRDYFLEGYARTPEKRRGRPPLPDDERRMNIITMRMTNSLKARMEVVAESEGCSLSHAIELCLERHLAAWDRETRP